MPDAQDSRLIRAMLADDRSFRAATPDEGANTRDAGAAAYLTKDNGGPTTAEDVWRVFAGRRLPTARQAA